MLVAVARHLVVALREGLDEDVRQRAGRRLAQAAVELAVQFPVAHGLAARAALEARGEIARIEPADEIEKGGEHRANHRVIVLAPGGERLRSHCTASKRRLSCALSRSWISSSTL